MGKIIVEDLTEPDKDKAIEDFTAIIEMSDAPVDLLVHVRLAPRLAVADHADVRVGVYERRGDGPELPEDLPAGLL